MRVMMEDKNLLSGGVNQLHEIKENLLDLHEYKLKYEALVQDEGRLSKSIQSLEKEMAEEIVHVTRKRRQEIENTYGEQISKIGVRIKRIKEKRDKSKDAKVSERIETETASYKEENKQLRLDIKTVCKQKHIPAICKTRIYNALYFPDKILDYLLLLCMLFLAFLAIPCSIYSFALPDEQLLYLVMIYTVVIIVFFIFYFLIGNEEKTKYMKEIIQIKEIREKIKNNNKNIAVIRKNIRRDRDESFYGLENYDEDMEKLEKEVEAVTRQQREAVTIFNNTTSQLIASDIKSRNEGKLTGLKADYDRISTETVEAEDKMNELTLKIASQHEPFIGKDFMTCERLDKLIAIMEAGDANTISDAIVLYKQGENK
jgi:hypothetical protein